MQKGRPTDWQVSLRLHRHRLPIRQDLPQRGVLPGLHDADDLHAQQHRGL
jgi:hypothetical protein